VMIRASALRFSRTSKIAEGERAWRAIRRGVD
jgi:hypothetical protein